MKQLVKNVNIFDGKSSSIIKSGAIVIEDNLVSAIEKKQLPEEGFDKVYDAKGQYAIPGLADAHVHLGSTHIPGAALDYDIAVSAAVSKKLLDHGITSVRDAGGITAGLKRAIDEGVLAGPRIFPSGAYISQTCGHGDSAAAHENRDIQYRTLCQSVLADGPDEVTRAAREQLYRGASQIKIMAGGGLSSKSDPLETLQFTPQEMKAAVDAAADYGTYVMAHLYTPPCIKRALKAGVKSLEHAHGMDEEAAKMAADMGAFVAPMPQFTDAEIAWNHMKKTPGKKSDEGDALRAQIGNTTELILKYNLKILFGTDLMIMFPDYEPRDGLDFTEYKKRFGSFKGLVAATGNFNDLVKLTTYQNPYPDGELGVLKAGSYADIVVVNGNPAEDLDLLENTENLVFIMKDGRVYKNTL